MSDDIPRELVHTVASPIYHRLDDESHEQYEAFVEWCKIPPSSRNLANLQRRTGFPPAVTRKLVGEFHWEVRATAFDHDSRNLQPDPRALDEEAALAGQLAAASTLLELGLNALQLKNPALIPVDKALKLAEKGIEIERRARGQADLNVQFTVEDMTRVNKMIGDVLGDEIEDAEIVSVDEDIEPDPDIPM